MNHLQGLNVLVLGLGLSGLAQARWCARCGARVSVADTRQNPPQLAALREELPQVRFVGGPFTAELAQGQDAVFKSPGLSPAEVAPVTQAARAAGLICGNELTLFAQALHDLAHPDPASGLGQAGQPQTTTNLAQSEAAQAERDADPRAEPVAAQEDDVQEDDGQEDDAPPAPIAAAAPPAPGYRPKVLAVTGTNGKTTVTALTGQLVARAGKRVAVAGNIGPTLLDTLAAALDQDALPEVWVLELSSFQLDAVTGFEPTAATVLNLSQDHLDWHGDMQAYAAAKGRIYGERGVMLLNRDDARVMAQLPAPAPVKGKSRAPDVRPHQTFGLDLPTRPGDWGLQTLNGMTWLARANEADETLKRRTRAPHARKLAAPEGGAAVLGRPGDGWGEEEEIFIQRLMPVDALRIRGRHNASNALAALALATAAGCAMAPMLHGLREYRGEPHRVEPVLILEGVEFFDDSKGTNVGATVAALAGLGAERRVVVILGGEGKGQDFTPLAAPLERFGRAAVLIGRDAPLIRQALAATAVPLSDAATLEQAVRLAFEMAHEGDAVLLSPACASFDMFDHYGHRAEVFCQAVRDLAEEQGVVP
jgi:UDP-N-acetylmuramoylalanine--D-glutamate ligase